MGPEEAVKETNQADTARLIWTLPDFANMFQESVAEC